MTPLVQLLSQTITLQQYFDAVLTDFNTSEITTSELINILDGLYTKQKTYLQNHAFDQNKFQSYVGHDGQWLDTKDTVMLTGQAMALLNHIATQEQASLLKDTTRHHVFKKALGGYQLNSLYALDKHPLGRAFYFAYGHKENGAVFSHMAMMYIYGLYNYGFIDEAKEGYMAILEQSLHPDNQVYRGIPEYFNNQGHGKYLYLTGSASWLLYILRRQVFGLHFELGKLYLNPKLHPTDFIGGKASIDTIIFNQKVSITYRLRNTDQKGYQGIHSIHADGQSIPLPITKPYKNIEVILE
jgi:cellobiose phosphorylase